MEPAVLTGKRVSTSDSESGVSLPKRPHLQSAPLLPSVSGGERRHVVYPHTWNPSGGKLGSISLTTPAQEKEEKSSEEEWKNVGVMLTCILGMVEKTQRAITILQQRQISVANIRTTEEVVAAVQEKANAAIMEVKYAAMKEIKKAVGSGHGVEDDEEVKS